MPRGSGGTVAARGRGSQNPGMATGEKLVGDELRSLGTLSAKEETVASTQWALVLLRSI